MTRLFFRFYLGVILILFVAWCIQVYVVRGTTESDNIKVIEDALGGGALSARDDLLQGGREHLDQTLQTVRNRFAYPVNIIERSDRPMSPRMTARVDAGEPVFHRGKMDVAITGTDLLVELGPLPQFAGPSRSDVLLGLGSVFLLAAGAIAFLLRPIATQLRNVEKTALAIADGDLSARISKGKRRRELPIVGAFNSMADRVESLLRSQKELLQAVSHELRTPLARIKFATELVRSADDDAKREKRIDSIDEATDKLDALVGELLDYTRYDAGAESKRRESISLDDLMGEAIELHSPLYPGIRFTTTGCSDSPEIYTYRAGLLRAVGNLVSNAGKYAKSEVHVSVHKSDEQWCIHVEDDGEGIAEVDRESVFEPFKRLAAGSHPGTGLGLALVRRICQRLGGDVSVAPSALGGARFTITVDIESS
ncbi:HAMP domain-containing sensor histidine kinase [Novipirellula sp. SH528]|uniref:HAMP domain-containing sensor histidine kinase n=1 Tax=Novipirellula sp. SH528 TaxID=3454466 RepID=UPI003FA14CF0